MNRRIVTQDEAAQDRDDIADYIAEDSPGASVRFLKAVRKALKQIAAMPGIGSLRDFNNPALFGLRVVLVPGFRNYGIYYLTTSDAVIILRVLHGARDLDAIFSSADE